MFIIQFIVRLVNIIRSAASPKQVAGGFILGMMVGLIPSFLNPLTFIFILLIIILNVNIATALFAMALFRALVYLFDPLLHSIGYALLAGTESLRGLWVSLYNMPFFPFTNFYNTVVMGSLITGLILMLPMFFLVKHGIIFYRREYEPKVQNWKAMKYLKSSQIYQLYQRIKFLGD
ncbi:MAG: TIGR03546 family protein [Calditrichia bacterium]